SRVKPDDRGVGQIGHTINYSTRDDSNLFYGPTGDYLLDSSNVLKQRRARVCFVWIKDEEVIEEIRETIIRGEVPGYSCISCGTTLDPDAGEYPDGESCPICGGDMNEVTLPPRVNREQVKRRAYPYGRLTVYSGKVLLYDGENPYD